MSDCKRSPHLSNYINRGIYLVELPTASADSGQRTARAAAAAHRQLFGRQFGIDGEVGRSSTNHAERAEQAFVLEAASLKYRRGPVVRL